MMACTISLAMTPFKVIPHMPSRSPTTISPTTPQGTPSVA